MDRKLSIPFAEDLTKEAGWTQIGKYLYFVARFHLHVEQNQTRDWALGDILRTYHTTSSSETEVMASFEEEFTTVDLKETTRSAALSNDLSWKISTAIKAAAKTPFYEVSSDIGTSLEQTIRASVAESLRSSDTISKREKKTFTVRQKINPGARGLQLAVAGYRKYSRSVFLHYIDYLFVEYRSTTFGLRKKRRNLPRPIGDIHTNRIPLNIPLFRLLYWNLESESSLVYTETEYQNLPKVTHPDRVTFEELHESISLPLPFRPAHPTLYALSNIAFPLHWVDRKGPWTREELEEIELEEADGSAWWYQHGPGRKHKG
ncbi:MAG: hypothetical protein EHM40_14945 [Chloroflexi bacterium]|nr:MAG: hypothetical protein EHM40_14945 [Chloroflexota bacterium]